MPADACAQDLLSYVTSVVNLDASKMAANSSLCPEDPEPLQFGFNVLSLLIKTNAVMMVDIEILVLEIMFVRKVDTVIREPLG